MTPAVEDLRLRLQAARRWSDRLRLLREVEALAVPDGPDLSPLLPLLVDQLRSGDEWVQQAAAEVLGKLGDPRSVEPLLALLPFDGHPLPDDLGPTPDHAILAHAMVARDEAELRRSAAHALGQLGDPRALPVLRACASAAQEDPQVRAAAQEALRRIEGRTS